MYPLRAILAFVLMLCPLATAQPTDPPAVAELLADVSAIRPGEPFHVGILLKMRPGWHVYWLNPGDSGQAPEVKWNLPEGFEISELQFPAPQQFQEPGNLTIYGYTDEVLLVATVTPPKDLKSGSTVRVGADVTWLVCEKVCLPGEADVSIELPVAESSSPANRQMFESWRARIPRQPREANAEVTTSTDWDKHEYRIDMRWNDEPPSNIQWFPPPTGDVMFSDVRVTTSGNATEVVFRFSPMARKPLPQMTLQSVVAYDASDGTRRGVLVPFDLQSGNRVGS